MRKLTLLDCTLRDGGYYNNWNFSKDLVNEYLKAIAASGIKFVEIGFRSLKENKLNGPNFFSRDNYIDILNIPKSLNIGVMINISEIISSNHNYTKKIKKLVQHQKKSKIKFNRLATHFTEISETVKICKILKKKNLR